MFIPGEDLRVTFHVQNVIAVEADLLCYPIGHKICEWIHVHLVIVQNYFTPKGHILKIWVFLISLFIPYQYYQHTERHANKSSLTSSSSASPSFQIQAASE